MARCALSELRQKESQHVSLERAEGRICAGVVTAFPPCIPILLPGEIVTAEQIATIKRLHREGATITGMESGIKVI